MNTEIKPSDYHSKLGCKRENIFADESYLSKSVLWELNESSLYKWRYHPKKIEPTEAMIWGSLIDCLTTTPELESEMIAVSPYKDFKKAEARQWRDEQLKAHKIVVTQETREKANYAVEMLLSKCKASAEIFEKSKGQVVVTGKSLGCNLKGLVDLVLPSCSVLHDLKTTASFSESGFSKTIADRGYQCQGGL